MLLCFKIPSKLPLINDTRFEIKAQKTCLVEPQERDTATPAPLDRTSS